jgi:hypothetical protein
MRLPCRRFVVMSLVLSVTASAEQPDERLRAAVRGGNCRGAAKWVAKSAKSTLNELLLEAVDGCTDEELVAFVKAGADVRSNDKLGQPLTLLLLAHEKYLTLDSMLSNNRSLLQDDGASNTLGALVVRRKNRAQKLRMLNALSKHHYDFDQRDASGRTTLLIALRENCEPDVIEQLLASKANLNAYVGSKSALDVANGNLDCRFNSVVETLERGGARTWSQLEVRDGGSEPIDSWTLTDAEIARRYEEAAVLATFRFGPQDDDQEAADACSSWVASCIATRLSKGNRDIDGCMRSVKTCTTNTPWFEKTCCAKRCVESYSERRDAGVPDDKALSATFRAWPRCMPRIAKGQLNQPRAK